MRKLLAVSSLLLFSSGVGAQTQTITFDPNGSGGGTDTIVAGGFDYLPSSALGDNALVAIGNFLSGLGGDTTFNLYSTGVLGSFTDELGADVGDVPTGTEFTYTLGFTQEVTAAFAGGAIATFGFVDGPVNFFELYYDTTPDANPLSGSGYNDGELILSGFVTSGSGNFVNDFSGTVEDLDQSANGNDYPNVDTTTGTGGSRLDVEVNIGFLDPDFFLDDFESLALDFTTQNILPFRQSNPTECYPDEAGGAQQCGTQFDAAGSGSSGDGNINDGFGGAEANIGDLAGGFINGVTGTDVLFQADANQSFQATLAQISEPGSIALLGVGLLGLLGAGRNRYSKKT